MDSKSKILIYSLIALFSSIIAISLASAACTTPAEGVLINSTAQGQLCNGTYSFNDIGLDGSILANANNIQIVCNNTILIQQNRSTSSMLLYVNGKTNVTITNCTFQGIGGGNAIWLNYAHNGLTEGNRIDNFSQGIQTSGTAFNSVDNYTIKNNLINNSKGCLAAIFISTMKNSRIVNNTILNSFNSSSCSLGEHAIYVSPTDTDARVADYLTIENNTIDGTSNLGIHMNGARTINSTIIKNNIIRNTRDSGFDFGGCVNCQAIDNSIYNTALRGFSIGTNDVLQLSQNCTVRNNTIYNTSSGDVILWSSANCTIQDNVFPYGRAVFNIRNLNISNLFINETSYNLTVTYSDDHPTAARTNVLFSNAQYRKELRINNVLSYYLNISLYSPYNDVKNGSVTAALDSSFYQLSPGVGQNWTIGDFFMDGCTTPTDGIVLSGANYILCPGIYSISDAGDNGTFYGLSDFNVSGNGTILNISGTNYGAAAFFLQNSRNVNIENISIIDGTSYTTYGFWINNGSNIKIKGVNTSDLGGGIYTTGPPNTIVTGLSVSNSVFDKSHACLANVFIGGGMNFLFNNVTATNSLNKSSCAEGPHGIYISNDETNRYSKNITIINSNLSGNYNLGVHVNVGYDHFANDTQIINNTIKNNGFGGGDFSGCYNCLLQGNLISNPGSIGWSIGESSINSSTIYTILSMITGNNFTGNTDTDIKIWHSANNSFINNTYNGQAHFMMRNQNSTGNMIDEQLTPIVNITWASDHSSAKNAEIVRKSTRGVFTLNSRTDSVQAELSSFLAPYFDLKNNSIVIAQGISNYTAIVKNGWNMSIYDYTAPSLAVNTPTNINNTNPITISFNVSDADTAFTTYYDDGSNHTYTVPLQVNLTNGTYIYYAYSFDTSGNQNSTVIPFNVTNQTVLPPVVQVPNSGGSGGSAIIPVEPANLTNRTILEKIISKSIIDQTKDLYLDVSSVDATFINWNFDPYQPETWTQTLNVGASATACTIKNPSVFSCKVENNQAVVKSDFTNHNVPFDIMRNTAVVTTHSATVKNVDFSVFYVNPSWYIPISGGKVPEFVKSLSYLIRTDDQGNMQGVTILGIIGVIVIVLLIRRLRK
jgi:parallel beta-helix repeat protein